MNLGTKDGFYKASFLQFVLDMSDLRKEVLGKIDMKEMNSWIEIDKRSAPQMIRAIDGKNYKGRRIRMNDANSQDNFTFDTLYKILINNHGSTKSMKEITQEAWAKRPLIISGPCSAETEEQVMQTAGQLQQTGKVDIMRAGIWKPRTRPGSFEGIGTKGLPWLQKARDLTGLPIAVEVATAKQVEDALHFDVDRALDRRPDYSKSLSVCRMWQMPFGGGCARY